MSNERRLIRLACASDIEAIRSFDPAPKSDLRRIDFIARSVVDDECFILEQGSRIAGFCVLNNHFFTHAFVALLITHPDFLRTGVASELMRYAENQCEDVKLFASTNESNIEMKALLEKFDFSPSGIIENLDEGDPELIYFKLLEK